MILSIILLTAFINLLLGIISFTKNPKSITNRLLTGLTIIFAFWTVANYFSLITPTEEGTLFWIRAVMFITAPLGPILYLFIRAFPNSQLNVGKPIIISLTVLTLLVQALAFTPFLFSRVTLTPQITPTPEPGLLLFAFLFVIVPLIGVIELIKKYRRTTGVEKLQLRYLALGIALTFFLLIFTNFFLVIVFKISQFVLFGPIFSLIFVGFIFYAIVKHRLLQIRLVIALSAAYTILITALAGVYTISIFLISKYLFQSDITNTQLIISVILSAFVVITFERFKKLIEGITNSIFFRGKYNSAELILELTTITASTYSLKTLTNATMEKLMTTLHIEQGVLIINKHTGRLVTVHKGYNKLPEYSKEILEKLHKLTRMIILDEEKNNHTRQLMQKLHAVIILPLIEQNKTVGFLLLGKKKYGEVYTSQDIELLEIFGPLVTVAIQNAKAYEEIKRFNKTLSERVQSATKELQDSHEKLKSLDKQKDAFLGMASHELKTPITSIKAFTQVLIKRAEKENLTKYAYILKNINMQTDRITQLINDLLNVSHIESGKLILKRTNVNLEELLEKVIADVQVTTDTHEIVKKGPSKTTIYADENRIEQVVLNLLTNAIKYSPNANKIVISVEEAEKNVTVSVEDFGQGIPLRDQKKIFERFYRTKEHEEKNISGFGLGLFIASEIIKRHKGKIWVTSTLNKGSIFSFTLPLAK